MTDLPQTSKIKLGLVIDLDTCAGRHACATSRMQWNADGITESENPTRANGGDR